MKSFLLFCVALLVVPSLLTSGVKDDSFNNLAVTVFSPTEITGVAASLPITYSLRCNHNGSQATTNVVVKDVFPKNVTFQSAVPAPTLQRGDTLIWNIGAMEASIEVEIVLNGIVKSTVTVGSEIKNTATVSSPFAEDDSSDNTYESTVYVESPLPDLNVSLQGALATPEGNYTNVAEVGMPVSLTILYFNNSLWEAPSAVVIDTLPANSAFISSDPAPSSRAGRVLTWNVDTKNSSEIKLNFRVTAKGYTKNVAVIRCGKTDRDSSDNMTTFDFDALPVLEPLMSMPFINSTSTDTVLTSKNPRFEGFARAGATVSLYEIASEGCYEPLADKSPVLLGKAVVDASRRWTITPTLMTASRPYNLVFQAEYKGELSIPGDNGDYWYPFTVAIDPYIDSSGLDMNKFTIAVGGQTYHTGAFGAAIGVPPNEDITYTFNVLLNDEILKDTASWEVFALKTVLTIDGQTTEEWTLPSQIIPGAVISGSLGKTATIMRGDVIIVQKGFGPGARLETWGNHWTINAGKKPVKGKMHLIATGVVDPAGFVYDLDIAHKKYEWPAVPPSGSFLTNATVTAMERTGDSTWGRWKAELYGQVNPQVTNETTKDSVFTNGYFSFLVQPGQYLVSAAAPGYMDYTSPVLTVVNEPVYHNVGMHRVSSAATAVPGASHASATPERYEVFQNYPNPFNPSTSIAYTLPVAGKVSIVVYDLLGREVATILNSQREEAGLHRIRFDAGKLASGAYFYRLRAGNFLQTKKMVIMK